MRLHKLAVALAALSITGAAVAAGTDTSTSTNAYPSTSQQAAPSASAPSPSQATPSTSGPPPMSQATPSASEPRSSAQGDTSQMGNSSAGGSASSEQKDPETVRSVQQALKDKGFDTGAVDGHMGPATEGALRKFQQAQGLTPSGSLDEQTLGALGVNGNAGAPSQGAANSSAANQ
jgi:hypothetical protein